MAEAILLQVAYQVWLTDNPRWPDCKMARCVFLSDVRDEVWP